MYTFYKQNCRMYTLHGKIIECIHSMISAVECIHSMASVIECIHYMGQTIECIHYTAKFVECICYLTSGFSPVINSLKSLIVIALAHIMKSTDKERENLGTFICQMKYFGE